MCRCYHTIRAALRNPSLAGDAPGEVMADTYLDSPVYQAAGGILHMRARPLAWGEPAPVPYTRLQFRNQ